MDNQKLICRLKEFQDSQSHDVFLIARSLRVMVAHGSFTTHGLQMFTKRECEAVEQLRQLIFQVCDQRLSEWLNQHLKDLNAEAVDGPATSSSGSPGEPLTCS